MEGKHKRGTLDFLQETFKYISNIRKPQVIEDGPVSPQPQLRVRHNSDRRKQKLSRKRPPPISLQPSYSVKYIGDIDGKISVLTTRVPLLRTSPKPMASTQRRSEIRLPKPIVTKAKKGHTWSLDFSTGPGVSSPPEYLSKGELLPMENFAPTKLQADIEEKGVIRWESFASLERRKTKSSIGPYSRRTTTSNY